ncbi:unnamed protein product [Mycena citricolor]|uniref:Uncharacterized protein n=1 Tax=Mycena citricolor TaxID=2018698 RepID=A0AAD2GY11_9AGAR|nr:unnamed protein product [Mycena citricolor]
MLASLLSVSKGFRTVLCKRPVAPQRNTRFNRTPVRLWKPSVDAFLEPNTSTWCVLDFCTEYLDE